MPTIHFRNIRLRNNAGLTMPECYAHAALLDLDKSQLPTTGVREHVTCKRCRRLIGLDVRPWFDAHGWLIRRIPRECWRDCSAPGPADDSVAYWRERLHFSVPRELAIAWLREFGAWDADELNESSDNELADRVLWLASCDLRERRAWHGLIH